MKEINTLRGLIENSAQLYSKNSAFILKNEQGNKYTVKYKEFFNDINLLSYGIYSLLNKSDIKVSLCCKNCYEWCVSYFAVTSGNGVLVPTDKDLPSEQIKTIFELADVDVAICDSDTVKKIFDFYNEADKKPLLICVEKINDKRVYTFEDIKKKGCELSDSELYLYKAENKDENILSVLLFTSGTTSNAKGVMLSEKNLCSDLKKVCNKVKITQQDVSLSVLPLHHTYEAIAFLMIIYRGGTICFCQSLRHLSHNFLEYRPTVFVTVPLMLEKLHKKITDEISSEHKQNKVKVLSTFSGFISDEKRRKIFEKIHSSFGGRLKKIIVGAASIRREVVEDFELFGIPVIIGYGLTECSPIVICNSDDERSSVSIGKPLDGVQVKIINKNEEGIGEICVKGPMVMLGYYNNKQATDESLVDGFLHTGDLGFCDDEGRYYITGRSKNVIVTSNGKNIYPEELEYYLNAVDLVEESLVCQADGDVITAQIFPNMSAVERKLKRKSNISDADIKKLLNEVIRAVNRKVPSYKRIRKLIIRTEGFAKTTTHKIKRFNENQ